LKANVVQGEVDVDKAERDYRRQLALVESDATSDLEMRDYLTRFRKAEAVLKMHTHELAEAEAFAKRIQEDLKKTVITSPLSGVVSKLNAEQGEVVVTGTMNNPGTVIMSISDLSRMQVRARIDEMDVPYVRADQRGRVYLQSEPDKPVPAKVVRVASKGIKTVGRDVVTFEALLEVLGKEARVKPGMTANVEIEVDERDDAITVPVEAVVHRLRKDLPETIVKAFDAQQSELDLSERVKRGQYIKVLYVKDGDVARVRLIDSGIADTRRVEIKDGIKLEDTVIIGPYRSLDQLEDGKKVALAEEDKKKAGQKEGADEEPKVAKGGEQQPASDQAKDEGAKDDDAKSDDAKDGADSKALAASATP
jgi:HlyD family secretion protein